VLNEGLASIDTRAFEQCCSLQSITFPSTFLEISTGAFRSCNTLREIVLNEGLQKFGGHVFEKCTSLQNITIPSTVDEIGSSAFFSCYDLRDVVLKEGIKKIKVGAFESCPSLERITIPSTVIEIEYDAFNNCSRLREVDLYNEEVQIDEKVFTGCTSLQRFKFPGLSTRLDNVIRAGQRDIEAKMDDIPSVEWRSGELSIPAVSREIENRLWRRVDTVFEVDKEKLDKIVKLIRYYEVREATTLFELALWKAKIDQAEGATDRGAYRTEVPGPVKDAILKYL